MWWDGGEVVRYAGWLGTRRITLIVASRILTDMYGRVGGWVVHFQEWFAAR